MSVMKIEPSDYIVLAVARKAGRTPAQISMQSRLFQDLGLAGDDAAELLDELSWEYKIDLSTFEFSDYFPSEPSLLSIFSRRNLRLKKELTVEALIRAAQNGRLAD